MNLAFTDQTPDDDIKSTTLHEFGHMLGLVHEHSQPLSPIQWNRPVVYREYAGPPNFWTPADVDRNIFNRYNRNQTQYSQFDPQSIMLYSFPPHYTINGFGTMRNWDLSVTDKDFIAQLYPFSHQIVLDEIVHINPDVLGTGRKYVLLVLTHAEV
jgi:serralysin